MLNSKNVRGERFYRLLRMSHLKVQDYKGRCKSLSQGRGPVYTMELHKSSSSVRIDYYLMLEDIEV